MHLDLLHAGRTRRLAKHPTVAHALKTGATTEALAACTPWYLRLTIDGRERTFKLPATNRDALSAARDILNGRTKAPATFSAFVAAQASRAGRTVGELAADWLAAGCPKTATKPRTAKAAAHLQTILNRALDWWRPVRLTEINAARHAEFALHRMKNVRHGRFSGRRTVDLELAALSCLFQWAVTAQLAERNPFEKREHFVIAEDIRHCHTKTAANDQQLHTLLAWFWSSPAPTRQAAGAALAFSALTGLRPGETLAIRLVPELDRFPEDPTRLAPGTIYPMPDGTRRMLVARSKGGQNPSVLVTPVLDDFLAHWRAARQEPETESVPPALFPVQQHRISNLLTEACAALSLPAMTPHGMRAYYVKVRRSAGADDATIAVELGQTSNGDLIRQVYGAPTDAVGGNLHDWLPVDAERQPVPAAWQTLKPARFIPVLVKSNA